MKKLLHLTNKFFHIFQIISHEMQFIFALNVLLYRYLGKKAHFWKFTSSSSLRHWNIKRLYFGNATDGIYIDVEDTIEKVEELRKERFQKARSFLNKVICYGILTKIEEFFNEHSAGRTWVYEHLKKLQAQLFTPQNIQVNRLLGCTPNKIQIFLLVFIPLVENFLPCLRFAADETMLASNINRKVLVPENTSQPLHLDMSDLPHITATYCCSVLGAKCRYLLFFQIWKNFLKN